MNQLALEALGELNFQLLVCQSKVETYEDRVVELTKELAEVRVERDAFRKRLVVLGDIPLDPVEPVEPVPGETRYGPIPLPDESPSN